MRRAFYQDDGTHIKYVSDMEYRDKLLEIIDTMQQEKAEKYEIGLTQG